MAAAELGARALGLTLALVTAGIGRADAAGPEPLASTPLMAQAPAAGRQTAVDFQRNVVRIIPKLPDGQDGPSGFGIVIGERDGRLFIATPDHVVRGSDELTATPDVVFHAEQGRRLPAQRLEGLRIPASQGDLAVVEIARPAFFRPATIGFAAPATVPDAAPIWNIGRTERWLIPTSPGGYQGIDVQTNHLMVEDLPTPPGSSGGAVLTERALLGMTLRDSGAQRITFVLRADRMVEAFQHWQLPVNFVTRASAAAPPPTPAPNAPAPTLETPPTPSKATPPPPPANVPLQRAYPTPPPQASVPPPATFPRPPTSPRSGEECDRLAASPYDSQRPQNIRGVDSSELERNAEAAIAACSAAFRQSPATARYGYQLARGFAAQRRYAESVAPARAAAEAGSLAAATYLGHLYRRGTGVTIDHPQAATWYRRVAATGDMAAQYNLAMLHIHGEGTRDDGEAFRWMKAAADQDHVPALTQVGLMYERGRGTSVDYTKARLSYEKAAAKGDEEAKRGLTRLSQSFGTPFVRPSQR